MEREFEKSLRYTSISNLNLINYYDSRQSTYRYDEGKKDQLGINSYKNAGRQNERSRTYSKPIKYKASQGSEISYADESFEYRKTNKLPNIGAERGGSFENNSTRNSIKKKFMNKKQNFAFSVKSPKKPFGKAKGTIKYV